MPRSVRDNYPAIKERLLRHQGIVNVSAASSIPLGIDNNNPVYWEGRGPEEYETIKFVCCDYDYFETFGMTMSHGRSFSREFSTDVDQYVINESALALTGYRDPLGRMFSMWTKEGKIIGVVRDFHGSSLHNEIEPTVFMLYRNLPYFYMFVKLDTARIPAVLATIEGVITQAVPDYVFDYAFLDDIFAQQYLREEQFKSLMQYFTALAIFIACLGMLGLISFMVDQRTREVAIRKVLGAGKGTIVGLLSRDFLILVGIAFLIAWPVAFALTDRWMRSYAYHTDMAWWVFLISGAAALLITLFTVVLQAFKAARAAPVRALRRE
jgi:putative ABC transport system permease protein